MKKLILTHETRAHPDHITKQFTDRKNGKTAWSATHFGRAGFWDDSQLCGYTVLENNDSDTNEQL